MKLQLINRTIMHPEDKPTRRELEREEFESAALKFVKTNFKVDEVFDLYEHDKEICIKFAQWVRDNTIADGAPKLYYNGKTHKRRVTMADLFEIYCSQL